MKQNPEMTKETTPRRAGWEGWIPTFPLAHLLGIKRGAGASNPAIKPSSKPLATAVEQPAPRKIPEYCGNRSGRLEKMLVSSPTAKPAAKTQSTPKPAAKAVAKSQTFLEMLGEARTTTQRTHHIEAARPIKPVAAEQPRSEPSPKEIATAVIAAADRARNGTSPRYAHERVADLLRRSARDTSAGVAAAVLNAAAKARGEKTI